MKKIDLGAVEKFLATEDFHCIRFSARAFNELCNNLLQILPENVVRWWLAILLVHYHPGVEIQEKMRLFGTANRLKDRDLSFLIIQVADLLEFVREEGILADLRQAINHCLVDAVENGC